MSPDELGMVRCMDCRKSVTQTRSIQFGDASKRITVKVCIAEETRPALAQEKWRRCDNFKGKAR